MKRKKQRSKKKNTAQAKLIKKMRASGKKVAVNPKGIERMSEVIENFAEPLLADCRSDDDIKKAIQFAVIVWNLSMLPKDQQDKKIQELVDTLSTPSNTDQSNQAKLYINSLITRKKEMFPHIQRTVIDYQFSGAGSNLRLDIASKDR
ncbi:MAG: hypothetical protein WGN25_13580 [Candidatus Electrothrix sp. GW3-4]|uniref:hypothetical protein n=1 Tax=Candidatus Electrothrix sp. GW3-4 TaxID=3126740 RepID=UPI0030D54E28